MYWCEKEILSMLRSRAERMLLFGTPLSRAIVPLLDGLGRQRLLRGGAAQREVRLNGMSINYYMRQPPAGAIGSDLPILLIHGIADGALTWSFVFGSLARTHPVYAIDLPGYGYSGLSAGRSHATLDEMRDLLALFLREVIGRPALVVGNSMGGWLAVKLAWAAPELMRGIVLLDAGGAPLNGLDSWLPFAEAIDIRDMRMARQVFRQMFGAIPAPLLYLGQHSLQETFQRQVVREFVAKMRELVPEEVLLKPNDLRNLPVPAALIWGLGDHFLPAGSLEFFRANMPDAPKLLLKHCGHLPQRERPLPVTRFIKQFAAQLAAAPKTTSAIR
jgi:pimeloyl-ACP methyl ester carboxylesterase